VEWCPAFVIPSRHSRATLDQEARDVEVPIPGGEIQGSLVIVVLAVNIRASLDQ
jgi:hypothetical protein